ncbi:MAG TPA: NADH-quinone oxidoreductase subunit C [Pyrinomonadaceae bacterium]|jgi:NADH-quinone oxidoreductase subunit C|nr:NADH-quinone oxidoreductase subunit C [Pyrinomonadaceae bacterium]
MTDERDKTGAASDDKAPSPGGADERAGSLPAPEGAPAPSPESQAALTGKAPSGSSSSGTTMPAASGEPLSSATTPAAPNTPTANETPEEKKARLARVIAEAKAKKEAAAAQAGGGAEPPGGASPATSDAEKAAKIAAAKAKAAALKATGSAAAPVATPSAPSAPAAAGAPKPPVKKKEEAPAPKDAPDHPLFKRLRGKFGEAVTGASEFVGQLSVRVSRERIVEVCEFLKNDGETKFDFLSDLTCVHYPDNFDAPFEIVYNLLSISRNARVRLKVSAGEGEGVDSVTSVWTTANWMEREVYDLFGVTFNNHPDLRRILLPDDWQGYPLRKDYPLEAMENEWTAKHLPEFSEVQQEQVEQRRAYGLELLSTPAERRVRDIFRGGKEVMPKEHK